MFKCKKCHAETRRFNRCDNCYKCDMCETKEGLCSYIKGVFCIKCHAVDSEERVEKFQDSCVSTDYEDEIKCPGCGYEFSDSWEFGDSGDYKCGECDSEFTFERDVSVSYTTRLK